MAFFFIFAVKNLRDETMKHNLLVFRIIEYGLNKQYFSFNELKEHLKMSENDETYCWQSLIVQNTAGTQGPNHLMIVVKKDDLNSVDRKDWIFSLLPSAIVSYVDYLEIVEARRNSKWAFILSLLAILISIAIGSIQIYYELTTCN